MKVFDDIPEFINNKYFIKNGRDGRKDYGGYSPCCTPKYSVKTGSTLRNCVAGAWGLFAMAENNPNCTVGFVSCDNCPGGAGEWYHNGKTSQWDKYERGKTPKLGAVICYTKHVAYVNEILDNGDLMCLSSSYHNTTGEGLEWRLVKKSEGYRWTTGEEAGGVLQGFIYPKEEPQPTPEPEPQPTPEPSQFTEGEILMAKDVLKGKYGNYPYRKDRIYDKVQSAVNWLLKNK